jgi:NAD(P)H-nitrite reductase large subunit
MTDRPKRHDDDVIVCRCEDVTLGEIRRLISEGYHTIDEIKRISRAVIPSASLPGASVIPPSP